MSTKTISELVRLSNEIEEMIQIFENDDSISLESKMSFGELFSRFGEVINKKFRKLLNFQDTADVVAPKSAGNLVRITKEKGISAMSDYRVYRLARQSEPMHKLIDLQMHQLEELADLEERLYQPLSRWFAGVLNDPEEFAEKPWTDRDLGYRDIEKMKESLRELFMPQGSRTDDSEFTDFITMYPSVKNFEACDKEMQMLFRKIGDIDLRSLRKVEELLMERLEKFIALDNDPESEFVIEKNARKKLAQTFRAIAFETEFLMTVLFQSSQAIGQWNNTVDLLKESLKD